MLLVVMMILIQTWLLLLVMIIGARGLLMISRVSMRVCWMNYATCSRLFGVQNVGKVHHSGHEDAMGNGFG